MEVINRSAFVINPRQPFLDWMHRADPTNIDFTLKDAGNDPVVLLVPESDNEREALLYLKLHCEAIFEDQLSSWYTVESTWPRQRGFEVFKEWFEWSYHSMILDVGDEPIEHEEL